MDARMQKAQVGLHSRGRTQRSHQRHCGRMAWTGWSRGLMLGKGIQYGTHLRPSTITMCTVLFVRLLVVVKLPGLWHREQVRWCVGDGSGASRNDWG